MFSNLVVGRLPMKETTAFRTKREATDEARRELKIGQVAKLSGIGVEALRFYEKSGLLGRPDRTQSGYRVYDSGVLQRLDFIKRSQILGFSLDEIKRIIADKEAGKSPCREVREIVRRRLDELDEQLKEMRRHRRELGAAFMQWEETGELDGHICGLIEGTQIEHPAPRRLNKNKRRR
jgi:MerR family copper efflux transcriptional regulator